MWMRALLSMCSETTGGEHGGILQHCSQPVKVHKTRVRKRHTEGLYKEEVVNHYLKEPAKKPPPSKTHDYIREHIMNAEDKRQEVSRNGNRKEWLTPH